MFYSYLGAAYGTLNLSELSYWKVILIENLGNGYYSQITNSSIFTFFMMQPSTLYERFLITYFSYYVLFQHIWLPCSIVHACLIFRNRYSLCRFLSTTHSCPIHQLQRQLLTMLNKKCLLQYYHIQGRARNSLRWPKKNNNNLNFYIIQKYKNI